MLLWKQMFAGTVAGLLIGLIAISLYEWHAAAVCQAGGGTWLARGQDYRVSPLAERVEVVVTARGSGFCLRQESEAVR